MNRGMILTLLVVPVFAMANPDSLQPAPKAKKKSFGVGMEFSAFFPTDKDIIRAFSSSTYALGLTPTSIYFKEGNHFVWDLAFNGDSQNGSRYFSVVPSFGYMSVLSSEGSASSFKPYFAARVGPAYTDYSVGYTGFARVKGRKFGWNANAEVGLFLTDKIRISARYDKFSELDGLDFGGLRTAITWQFARF